MADADSEDRGPEYEHQEEDHITSIARLDPSFPETPMSALNCRKADAPTLNKKQSYSSKACPPALSHKDATLVCAPHDLLHF